MRKILIYLLLLFIAGPAVIAQEAGMIRGRLVDSVGGQSLSGALVRVLRMPDSLVRAVVFSREDASFEAGPVGWGLYLIEISFQGYKTRRFSCRLDEGHSYLDVGNVYLPIAVSSLDSVTVRTPPVAFRKDTLEYNAASYKTDYYDPVKELLRRLPGMEVDNDGSIRVGGRVADQVLVDGKPFFNGSSAIAMQNIPAEIIGKVQVYDAADDASVFSGMNNGVRKKTINLVIKPGRRKGEFGKLVAGGGDQGTYAAGANINRLDGVRQLAVIGQANNSGTPVFEPVSIPGAVSGPGESNSGGITRTAGGGINYRDSWGGNNSSYGSYQYNDQRTRLEQVTSTQNFLPGDSSTFNTASVKGLNSTCSHLFTYNIEQKLGPSNSLIIRPKLDIQHGTSVQDQFSSLRGPYATDTLYRSSGHNSNVRDGQSFSGNIIFGHRCADKAKTLSVDVGVLRIHNSGDAFTQSQTVHFIPDVYIASLGQHALNRYDSWMIFPTLTYVAPIHRDETIGVVYKFRYNQSSNSNQVFRYDSGTKSFHLPDSLQTNAFKEIYSTHNIGVNWRLQRAGYDVNIGNGVQSDELRGGGGDLKKEYLNLTPSAALVYHFSAARNVQLNYSGNPVALSIQQLQPVSITADSLYIQKGNLALRQPYTHLLGLTYTSSRPEKQAFLSVLFNYSMTVNDIQSSVTHTAGGVQVAQPVNVDGAFALSGSFNYSHPSGLPGSNIGLSTDMRYTRTPGFVDNEKNITRNATISQSISWGMALAGRLDIAVKAVATYSIVQYSLQQGQNSNYFTLGLSSSCRYIYRGWSVMANGYYFFNNSLPPGFNQVLPLLSAGIGRRLLKSKALEMKVTAYDLLNQQTGLSRAVTANTIQDMRTIMRGRYFMIYFSYDLRHFGGGRGGAPRMLPYR